MPLFFSSSSAYGLTRPLEPPRHERGREQAGRQCARAPRALCRLESVSYYGAGTIASRMDGKPRCRPICASDRT